MIPPSVDEPLAAVPGYEVLERLGGGGQADVYRAAHRQTGRVVAIKIIPSAEGPEGRAHRELQSLVRLNHPGIVQVFDNGEAAGRAYIVLEYIDGLPINDHVLARCGSVEQTVRLFLQVLQAVTAAHQQGVLHRDLHPHNILVTAEGQVKVVDFGLARQYLVDPDCPVPSRVTCTGQILGTLPYLSPEQARGRHAEMDVRSDLYALGVILFELLTGRLPYPLDSDPVAMIGHIVTTPPAALPRTLCSATHLARIPSRARLRELQAVIQMALEKRPADRYASVANFHDDLVAWLDGNPVRARGLRPAYLLRKALGKYRAALTSMAVMILVTLTAGAAVTHAWTVAREERNNARSALTAVHATFHDVMAEIDETVQRLAGGTASRARILEVVGRQFGNVYPLLRRDEALRPALTELLERQGDLDESRGDTGPAREHYEEALGSLGVYESSNLAARVRLQRKLARCEVDPVARLEDALVDGLGTEDPGVALETVRVAGALAYYEVQVGRAQDAADTLAQAKPLMRFLASDDKGLCALAEIDECQGEACAALADPDAATAAFEGAAKRYAAGVAAHPEQAMLRHRRARALLRSAQVLLQLGRIPEAETRLDDVRQEGAYLVGVDPSAWDWRRDYLGACYRLGELRLQRGDPEAASALVEAALQQLGPSGRAQDRTELVGYLNDLRGRCLLALDLPEAAIESFVTAVGAFAELVTLRPDWGTIQCQLAATLNRAAYAYEQSGDSGSEYACLCRAVSTLENCLEHEASAQAQLQLAAILTNLAQRAREACSGGDAHWALVRAHELVGEAARTSDPRLGPQIGQIRTAIAREQLRQGRRDQ